jgi:hypothetical protein
MPAEMNWSILIYDTPTTLLKLNQNSKTSNLSSTLKYPSQAPSRPTMFLGHSMLPLLFNSSTCSSNTVLEQYLARIRNVLTGPCFVWRFSSRLLVRSFVFKINKMILGTCPSSWTSCCSTIEFRSQFWPKQDINGGRNIYLRGERKRREI